ncbi:hypothetical protein BH24ACI5_BH24ACI5_06420 [soil metagenome]
MGDAVRHLGETQMAEAVEGRLDADSAAHLAGCQTCSARVSELEAVMRTVSDAPVPEPSPLFWDQFPSRVSHAIEAPAATRGWFTVTGWAWGSAAAVVMVAVMVLLGPMRTTPGEDYPVAVDLADSPVDSLQDDLDADEAWALVRSVADGLHYDDAREAGVSPRPGSIERVAMELSADERAELARLIAQELSRTGA